MKNNYYINAYDPILKINLNGSFTAETEAEAIQEACRFWQLQENNITRAKPVTAENKSYCITENEIEELENIISYFKYHNKNLNKNQDYMMYKLEVITDNLRTYYCGTSLKNDLYITEL